MPLKGAEVVLSLDGQVLGLYKTDIDGRTELIRLPPGDGYYISVTSKSFEKGEYGPIPVIRNITTVQNAELLLSLGFDDGNMPRGV